MDNLRRIIGNVPQDATLFNDTVMNNVRYAKVSATAEEVHETCKAAAIHDKILTFSKGYQTKVGEGGMGRGWILSPNTLNWRLKCSTTGFDKSRLFLTELATEFVCFKRLY